MAKDRSEAERAERKEKKRKEKREHETVEDNGVKKAKKDKKKDKDLRRKVDVASTTSAAQSQQATNGHIGDMDMKETPNSALSDNDPEADGETAARRNGDTKIFLAKEDLVPFANPLADEKVSRRLLRGVTQGAKQGTLKRGVKEGVKFARKAREAGVATGSKSSLPFAVALIAADVSPADVISHLPVLCEDYNIPYIFINSRRELGQAAITKRPTSIIFATREKPTAKRDAKAEHSEGTNQPWETTYENMVKIIKHAGESVMI